MKSLSIPEGIAEGLRRRLFLFRSTVLEIVCDVGLEVLHSDFPLFSTASHLLRVLTGKTEELQ